MTTENPLATTGASIGSKQHCEYFGFGGGSPYAGCNFGLREGAAAMSGKRYTIELTLEERE